jgi:hypothetical protein
MMMTNSSTSPERLVRAKVAEFSPVFFVSFL